LQTKLSSNLYPKIAVKGLCEKWSGGVPEMVIPLQGTERSRGLLAQAAQSIGRRAGVSTGGAITGPLIGNVALTINGVATERAGSLERRGQSREVNVQSVEVKVESSSFAQATHR
jgi:hypothetical protein